MDLLKSINVFQAVAEQQSFSRAADHLNLVPSAVSRQISELEKWLGVGVFQGSCRLMFKFMPPYSLLFQPLISRG